MSAYDIFYGQTYSVMWYILYYGKYILAVLFIVLSYRVNSDTDIYLEKMRNFMLLLLIIPVIAIFLYSVALWIVQGASLPYITRGISDTLFRSISVASGVCVVSLLKRDTVNCAINALISVYVISLLLGFVTNGTTLFTSVLLGKSTSYTELHEVAFVMGLYLIFQILINRNDRYFQRSKVKIIICAILFLISWKRIGIAALLLTFLFDFIIIRMKKYKKSKIIKLTGAVGIVVCLIYVYFSMSNELTNLLNSFGIPMMGRNIIYSYFSKFGEFSPTYFGYGVGFVGRQFTYTTSAELYNMSSIKALHNDFMKNYINIGFIGFLIWCWYLLMLIPSKIEKKFGTTGAYSCILLIFYAFITYTTDNTEGYFNFQMHLSILITLSCYFEMNRKMNRISN